jgi:hypothetical protein
VDLGRFFAHFFRGKFRGKFSRKNVGENWNFQWKKLRKIFPPRNSEENSAETTFPRKNVRKNATSCLDTFGKNIKSCQILSSLVALFKA